MKRFLLLLALALPVSLSPAMGCNGQTEGQRCDPNNKDTDGVSLDCATGLTCNTDQGAGIGFCCSPNSANLACVSIGKTTTTSSSSSSSSASSSSSGGGAGGNGTGGNGTGGAAPDGGTDDAGDAGDGG
ncbi:Hypothetical protein A7982_00656 [Minicystis rosea]|nr:Hypothetical protein A7982_00656 [Minicystis rosea]